MMKRSHRARRMERRHKRKAYSAPIMLTSLMDIFTVLVCFLLANSSGNQLPNNRFITLPKSTATAQPVDTLTIQVSGKEIIVEGDVVASVADVMASDAPDIPALVKELKYRANNLLPANGEDPNAPRKIKILGDKHIPFALLKKVMVSCTETVYTKISFAVLMKAEKA